MNSHNKRGESNPDDSRWDYINSLDEELLKGGVILSEYVSELIRNTDLCYVSEAYVAGIVMSAAAIETFLRSEGGGSSKRFVQLIREAGFDEDLRKEMDALRVMRNKWVHVGDPWDDDHLLQQFNSGHPELERDCREALRILRKVAYHNQWI